MKPHSILLVFFVLFLFSLPVLAGTDTIEAEHGATGTFSIHEAVSASNQAYVAATKKYDGSRASYRFSIPVEGTYQVKARILTPDPTWVHDSFFVGMDDEPADHDDDYAWHTGPHETFEWVQVTRKNLPDSWVLSAGTHTVHFYVRENDTHLDAIRIPGAAMICDQPGCASENVTENDTSPGNDTFCPGDANGDDKVDVLDLNIVSVNYGLSSGFDSRADLNGDGVVDVVDIVSVNYGTTCAGTPSSEETMTLVDGFSGWASHDVDFSSGMGGASPTSTFAASPVGTSPADPANRITGFAAASSGGSTDDTSYHWTQIGPGAGGWFRAVRFHPDDPNIVYMGGDRSGMHKSYDGGKTWKIRSDGLYHHSIEDIAVYGDTVIIATNGGVYKSEDAGEHWKYVWESIIGPLQRTGEVDQRSWIASVFIHPADPNLMFAGSGGHHPWYSHPDETNIYRSTDGGETWEIFNTGLLEHSNDVILSFSGDPHDENIVFAGTRNNLYRSTDAGKTWSRIRPKGSWYSVVDPKDGNIVYTADYMTSGGRNVYKSTDGGHSWMTAYGGMDEDAIAEEIHFDPKNPENLYAGIRSRSIRQIYKSIDGGTSWQNIGVPDWSAYNALPAWLKAGVATSFDVQSGKIIFVPTILLSDNDGQTWEPGYTVDMGNDYWKGTGPEILVARKTAIHPTIPGKIYSVVADKGLLMSLDYGDTWKHLKQVEETYTAEKMDENGNPYKCYSGWNLALDKNNPDIMYAGMIWNLKDTNGESVGVITKSTDGGETWNELRGLPERRSQWLSTLQNGDVFVYLQWNGLWRSQNGGSSWVHVSDGLPNNVAGVVLPDPRDENTVYLTVQWEGLWKSTRGGDRNSWTKMADGVITHPKSLDIGPDGTIWIGQGSSNTGVWKSTDGGEHFTRVFKLETDQYGINAGDKIQYADVAVDPADPDTVYVGMKDSGIVNRVWVGPGVYVTRDGGQTWSSLNDGLVHGNVYGIDIDSLSGYVYAATDGHGTFRLEKGKEEVPPEVPPASPPGDPDTSTVVSGTQVTIVGRGQGIGDGQDVFRYFYRTASGDFDIYVQIKDLQDNFTMPKAGLMFRESLASDSRNIFYGTTGSSLVFQKRSSTGGITSILSDTAHGDAAWVRLRRRGDVFKSFFSFDGITWHDNEQYTVPMAQDLFVGLAVSPGEDSLLTAVFDQVHISNASSSLPSENYLAVGQVVEAEAGDLVSPMGVSLQQEPTCAQATEICDNNHDDDCDGLVDCADGDCASSDACAPGDRGFIRIDPDHPHTFKFDNGERFFPFGDTSYYLLSEPEDVIHEYIDSRNARGFNFIRVIALGRDFWPFKSSDPSVSNIDEEKMQKLDRLFDYAASRDMNIELLIWGYGDRGGDGMWGNTDQETAWVTYLVQRYADRKNLFMWTITNEFERYPDDVYRYDDPQDDDWAASMAQEVKRWDTHHVVGVHAKAGLDKDYKLDADHVKMVTWPLWEGHDSVDVYNVFSRKGQLKEEWTTCPTGNKGVMLYDTPFEGKTYDAVWTGDSWLYESPGLEDGIAEDWSKGKPVINTEMGYQIEEGVTSSELEDCQLYHPDTTRMNAWKTVTAGGFIAEGFAHTAVIDGPMTSDDIKTWRPEQFEYLYDFFTTKTEYWKMAPHLELVADENSLLAKPGVEYVAYFPEGGTNSINLEAGTYTVEWLHAKTGDYTEQGTLIVSAGNRDFTPPYSAGDDWVLHLKNA
ncbi:MAG: hypothetical protein GXP63_02585 [DPANN group archaeon]|nr:hypothetical protein [DPANN group archaeon]